MACCWSSPSSIATLCCPLSAYSVDKDLNGCSTVDIKFMRRGGMLVRVAAVPYKSASV